MADQITVYHSIVKPDHGKDPWSEDYYDFVDKVDVNLKDTGTLSNRPLASDVPSGVWYETSDETIIYRNDPNNGWVATGHGQSGSRVPESYIENLTTGQVVADNGIHATANDVRTDGFWVGQQENGLTIQGTNGRVVQYSIEDDGWAWRSDENSPAGAFEDQMTLGHDGRLKLPNSTATDPEDVVTKSELDEVSSDSSTAEEVSNLSIHNWNVIDVGNNGFPGDRTGGDLAQFIRDNVGTGHTKFVLPEGTYEWQQTLQFDNTDLTIPDGLQIVGKPEATIHVTSGVQNDVGRCMDLGDVYGAVSDAISNVYIANLHFDVGYENTDRDAGIARCHVGDNFVAENLSITRRWRKNDEDNYNGDRFTWRMDVAQRDGTAIMRNFDFTAGDVYVGPDSDPTEAELTNHAIPFGAENDHYGTSIYEGCRVAGYIDNGFYLKDGPGSNVVRNCYVKNCGGGGYRLGQSDRMESCYIEYDNTYNDAWYGAGIWVEEGEATSVDGCRMNINANINDCIRVTSLMGGLDLANIYLDLANTGDYVFRDSTSATNEAMIHVRDMTVYDACDGSVREGACELRNENYTFEGLTWYATGGRLPFTQRYTTVKNATVKDSYFELNGTGVARVGSSLDAPDVDYTFDNCKFVNTGSGTALLHDGRATNSLERLVLRDCDARDYSSLFAGSTTLSNFTVGRLESTLGYGDQSTNSY